MVYLRMQKLYSLSDIEQLLLRKFASPLCLFQNNPKLLQFGLKQGIASLYNCNVLLQIIIGSKRVIKLKLGVLQKFSLRKAKVTFVETESVIKQ